MTDTPSSGASANARVHGDPDAFAALDIKRADRPIVPAETEAAFRPTTLTDLADAYKASQVAKLSGGSPGPQAKLSRSPPPSPTSPLWSVGPCRAPVSGQ